MKKFLYLSLALSQGALIASGLSQPRHHWSVVGAFQRKMYDYWPQEQRFVDAGFHDISVADKGFKATFDNNNAFCLDVSHYLGNGPFWLGVRNLGVGFSPSSWVQASGRYFLRESSATAVFEDADYASGPHRSCLYAAFPVLLVGASVKGHLGGGEIAFGYDGFGVDTYGSDRCFERRKLLLESTVHSRFFGNWAIGIGFFGGAHVACKLPTAREEAGVANERWRTLYVDRAWRAGAEAGIYLHLFQWLRFGLLGSYEFQPGVDVLMNGDGRAVLVPGGVELRDGFVPDWSVIAAERGTARAVPASSSVHTASNEAVRLTCYSGLHVKRFSVGFQASIQANSVAANRPIAGLVGLSFVAGLAF